MRAILIAQGFNKDLQSLNERYPTPMLPVIDRPFIQHIIEYLVNLGFDRFDVINSHLPEITENLLQDGARWGCKITHHLASDPSKPYNILKTIDFSGEKYVLIVHADRLIDINENTTSGLSDLNRQILFIKKTGPSTKTESGEFCWTGWALLNRDVIEKTPKDCNEKLFFRYIEETIQDEDSRIQVEKILSISCYRDLLDANISVLNKEFTGLQLSGREVEEKTWLSRNVSLHPLSRVVPPVYIGENCSIGKGVQIGPNVVIGSKCILEENSRIKNTVIFSGSYIGVGLELEESIVDKNRLVNVKIGVEVSVADDFLLGSLSHNYIGGWISKNISRITAIVLFMIVLPVFILTLTVLKLFRKGNAFHKKEAVRIPAPDLSGRIKTYRILSFAPVLSVSSSGYSESRRSGVMYFVMIMVPALINVIRGELRFVGVSPRSQEEINSMPDDWKMLYLKTKAGIITESFVNYGLEFTQDELYTSEVFYSVKSSFRHDLKLILKSFKRLMKLHRRDN